MLTGLFRIAVLVAAVFCATGCGGYDMGPDPQPWTPSTEAPPASPH